MSLTENRVGRGNGLQRPLPAIPNLRLVVASGVFLVWIESES